MELYFGATLPIVKTYSKLKKKNSQANYEFGQASLLLTTIQGTKYLPVQS
jgi:hypothetical protein